jgi:flagellar motility protein MotE (MotC chaperone)
MRPEAASEQLSKMDEGTAAAILSRLEPRAASTILNDIQAEKAARLTMILTSASRKNDRGDKS